MRTKFLILLGLILIIHTVTLTKLIFFPYSELFIYPYLTNQGLIPYKQIFDQHFPGLLFLPINFNNLGMTTVEIARIWLIAVTNLTQILIFIIAYKIFRNYKLALFANLLYLLFQPFLEGWTLWIDNFLPLFYLPAFYLSFKFITDKKSSNFKPVLIGLLLGIAILFKQTALPLALMVGALLFYYQRDWKTITLFLAGLLPLPLLMVLYFYYLGALVDFWFWTVYFNLTTYAKYGRPLIPLSSLTRVAFLFSPVVLLSIIKDKILILTLGIFLVGALAGVFDRFGFIHFQPALPLAIFAMVLIFSKLWFRPLGRFLISGFFLVILFWLINFYRGSLSSRVILFDSQVLQISERIRQLSKPNEEIFIFGAPAHLYQLTQTIPAGRIFVFQFPWFLMESEDRLVKALQKSKPNLVVRDRNVIIDGQPITKFAQKLDNYTEHNYTVIDKIGSTEFLIRR